MTTAMALAFERANQVAAEVARVSTRDNPWKGKSGTRHKSQQESPKTTGAPVMISSQFKPADINRLVSYRRFKAQQVATRSPSLAPERPCDFAVLKKGCGGRAVVTADGKIVWLGAKPYALARQAFMQRTETHCMSDAVKWEDPVAERQVPNGTRGHMSRARMTNQAWLVTCAYYEHEAEYRSNVSADEEDAETGVMSGADLAAAGFHIIIDHRPSRAKRPVINDVRWARTPNTPIDGGYRREVLPGADELRAGWYKGDAMRRTHLENEAQRREREEPLIASVKLAYSNCH